MSTTAANTGTDRLVVDLLDPELYRRNPHDVWAWMRANEPVYHDERNGLWGISRHADVMDVERRSNVFASGGSYRAVPAPDEINMIAQDDPRHRQQRMLVQEWFTRSAARQRETEFRALITELIDAVLDAGQMELVDDLAGQLPARLTCRLIGFPEEDWRRVKSWSERLMRTDMRERDEHTLGEFMEANREFMTVVQELAPQRLANPQDDLLSVWLQARIEGEPLPPFAIMHEVGLFIAGGAETTRTAISHGMRAFADHPEQWDAMAADPSLVPGAVDEVLRWVTPLNNFFRRAVVDAEVGGQRIAEGERVMMIYPSANRDEAVFADPFVFDIRRNPNPHLAFGYGTHLCLGMNFAREELRVLFEELSKRLTDLRPIAEPDVEANIFARAVKSFPLAFRAR
jgi:cholest-4-en-3-one 26-monooxygenase